MTREYELVDVVCPTCAMVVIVPELFVTRKKIDHSSFHLPCGHSMYYPIPDGEDSDSLKRTITALRSEIAELKMDKISLIRKLEFAGIEA